MQASIASRVLTFNILDFLECIQPEVNSLEELLVAIREENIRVGHPPPLLIDRRCCRDAAEVSGWGGLIH